MPKLSKTSLHIFLISPEKRGGCSYFLPADKHKSFLQIDSITVEKRTSNMKSIFCLQINIKGFFKLILSFYVCVARHGQITQNNKFASFCNLLRENLIKLIFFMQNSMNVSHKLILRFFMGMVKPS